MVEGEIPHRKKIDLKFLHFVKKIVQTGDPVSPT